jgi:hypothetical protein
VEVSCFRCNSKGDVVHVLMGQESWPEVGKMMRMKYG